MSHLHIPDGVLPAWLVIAGWVVAGGILALISWRLRKADSARQLPLLGVMAAVMLVGMSTEIVPIAYHVNLSVLAGIVLGPSLGFLAALIVNLMLAMFGHGGITVAGVNSLVIGTEVVLGYYLFRGAWAVLRSRRRSPGLAAVLATIATLIVSTMLMIGVVGISNLDPSAQSASVAHEGLGFKNPFEHGLVTSEFSGHEEESTAPGSTGGRVNLLDFARLVLLLGSIGWAMEGLLTGAIVGFIYRVRPGLIVPSGRTAAPGNPGLPGGGRASTDSERPGIEPSSAGRPQSRTVR